jgi:ribulose-phosphate 3-epimerase
MINIYPSLMAIAQKDLAKEINLLQPHCAGFHLDVMDNIFVPNLLWNNPDEINEIVKMIKNQVWIHLMIEKPDVFYEQLVLPAGSLVSFHIESKVDVFCFAKTIKEKKHQVSLAMRPKTPVEKVLSFFDIVDQILIMSVEPGASGQTFLESSFEKISALVKYREQHNAHFSIGVDGGVSKNNIKRLAQEGVDDFAIATAIFGEQDHVVALQKLQN